MYMDIYINVGSYICIYISAANYSKKVIMVNLRMKIFNLGSILILILAILAISSKVYGAPLLMEHGKCPKKQVWSAKSYILSLSVVTNCQWMAEKQVLLRCANLDFGFYIKKQAFQSLMLATRLGVIKMIITWLLIDLECQFF